MRSSALLAALLLTATLPAFAQSSLQQSPASQKTQLVASTPTAGTSTTTPAVLPADATDASVDYAALREQVAQQNKVLAEQVAARRAVVRKNQELLREAQKLHAQNQKLLAERQKLEAQNTDLEKQRDTLKSQQKPTAE